MTPKPPPPTLADVITRLDMILAALDALKRVAVQAGTDAQTSGLKIRLW